MAVWPRLLPLLAAALSGCNLVLGVSPDDLEKWLASPVGLGLSSDEAWTLAQQNARPLTLGGITLNDLQTLRETLADYKGIDLSLGDIRANLLLLAEQHITPEKITSFYDTLTSGYTVSGGLGYSKAPAQQLALKLSLALADVNELKAVFQVMYGWRGLGFSHDIAQESSVQLATFGADATTYKETYSAAKSQGKSSSEASDLAFDASVAADLQGLPRRYAKDGTPYTAAEFQKYYNSRWHDEWAAAPSEKRLSTDKKAYTVGQFSRHFGSSWAAKFRASAEATQVKMADDGKVYNMAGFRDYYHDSWQAKWSVAAELPCQECAPYTATAPIEQSLEQMVI